MDELACDAVQSTSSKILEIARTADAFSAFGVGQGGGAGATFSALADHVSLTTGQGGAVGYDFAVGQTPSVPEPATWAMMLLGFGGIGFHMRSKRKGALLAA